MLTYISLFSGIGGLTFPTMRCVAHVENDSACQSVLRRHWSDVPILGDVRECGAHNLSRANVIAFGSPCQDLSVAGRRKGLSGERSELFFEAIRICAELRPDLAVWENVPGAFSSHAGRDFAAVLAAFRDIGARDIAWRVLDARYFGVAQRRRRVFLVADFRGERAAEILFEPPCLPGPPAAGRAAGPDVAACITASAGHHGRSSPRGDGSDNLIVETLGAAFGRNRGLEQENEADMLICEPFTFDWQAGVAENDRAWLVDKPGRTRALTSSRTLAVIEPMSEHISNTLSHHHGRNSGEDTFVVGALSGSPGGADDNDARGGRVIVVRTAQTGANGRGVADGCAYALDGANGQAVAFTERTRAEGRTLEIQEEIAYALTNPGSGGRTHSRQIAGSFGVRRLTPVECERLQGFDDGWTAWGIDATGNRVAHSDSARYRMTGNAVCKKVSAWLGRRIEEVTR